MKSIALESAAEAGADVFRATYPGGEQITFYKEGEVIDDTPQDGVALYWTPTYQEMHALACGGTLRMFMPEIVTPPLTRVTVLPDEPVSKVYTNEVMDYLGRIAYAAGEVRRAVPWEEAGDAVRALYTMKVARVIQAINALSRKADEAKVEKEAQP